MKEGWTLGIAGRREDRLEAFRQKAPERIYVQRIDILEADADQKLEQLIGRLGGMDLYLHSSGIGFQNASLNPETEIRTLETNGTGFVRMVSAAYRYFRTAGKAIWPSSVPLQVPRDWDWLRHILPANGFRIPTWMHWSSWHTWSTCPWSLPTSARDLWQPTCSTTESIIPC